MICVLGAAEMYENTMAAFKRYYYFLCWCNYFDTFISQQL